LNEGIKDGELDTVGECETVGLVLGAREGEGLGAELSVGTPEGLFEGLRDGILDWLGLSEREGSKEGA